MADARDLREDVRPVADERGAEDGRADPPVLDQVGLGRGEDELAARDVHLPAAEVLRVEAARHRAHDLVGVVLAGEHEGVGHARQRDGGVALAAAVAGRRHLHEAAVQPVLQVAAQDAVLDQHRAAGHGSPRRPR